MSFLNSMPYIQNLENFIDDTLISSNAELDITFTSAVEEGKKYNSAGKKFLFDSRHVKGVSLIAECKQHSAPLSLAYIVDQIVHKKFLANLYKWKTADQSQCRTFIIFALKLGELEESKPTPSKKTEIISAQFHLWLLSKDSDGVFRVFPGVR